MSGKYRLLILLILVSGSFSFAQEKQSDKPDWRPLFNGKDINDWFVKNWPIFTK